ncbi:MAG TPA: hypothetical protein VNW99_04355, partial [Cytophagaceae bacterium]|nr:hypothetical protein [Cytophagaceae bacterium]
MNRHKYTDDIWYPIEVSYDASKVVPVSKLPHRIKVNATGEGWDFLRKAIRFNVIPVTYAPHDLPRKKFITAKELLPVAEEQIEGIHINYIMEDTIRINFDYLETKEVYLKLNYQFLSLAPNYNLIGPVNFNPVFIKFSGPGKLVKKLPDSILVSLPYKNIKGKFQENIRIDFETDPAIVKDHHDAILTFNTAQYFPETVQVEAELMNVPSGKKIISESKVTINYSVTEKDKDRFGPSDFRVVIDLSRLDKDHNAKIVLLSKPASIINVSFNPSFLKVAYEN